MKTNSEVVSSNGSRMFILNPYLPITQIILCAIRRYMNSTAGTA